jgi:osmotically-inducible protein OsmY
MEYRSLIAALFVSAASLAMPCGNEGLAQTAAASSDDLLLATAVKARLAAKPELHAGDLKITCVKGEVTISGEVESGKQLYEIAETAQMVPGVTAVKNEMMPKN